MFTPSIKSLSRTILIGFLITTPLANSNQRVEKSSQLQKTEQEITRLEKALKRHQKTQNKHETELKKLEKSISTSTRNIAKNRKALKKLEKKLRELEQQKQNTEKKLAQQKEALAEQLKGTYINGQHVPLKLILNQEDPSQARRMLKYHHALNQAQKEAINDIKKTQQELEELNQQTQQQQATLSTTIKKQTQERQQLKTQQQNRQQLLKQIASKISSNKNQLDELEAEAEALRIFLTNISRQKHKPTSTNKNFEKITKAKGKLKWPTRGRVRNQNSKTSKWQGVFIEAPKGRSVNALYNGTVVFADWFRGLGLLLIVDHGSGYMSLYGHNLMLYKEVGDFVEQNEIIAQVGDTGGNKKTGLYFEIRRNGKVENPRRWVR